jgi:hypothetical protein
MGFFEDVFRSFQEMNQEANRAMEEMNDIFSQSEISLCSIWLDSQFGNRGSA